MEFYCALGAETLYIYKKTKKNKEHMFKKVLPEGAKFSSLCLFIEVDFSG